MNFDEKKSATIETSRITAIGSSVTLAAAVDNKLDEFLSELFDA